MKLLFDQSFRSKSSLSLGLDSARKGCLSDLKSELPGTAEIAIRKAIKEPKRRQAVKTWRCGGDADAPNVPVEPKARDTNADDVHRIYPNIRPAK